MKPIIIVGALPNSLINFRGELLKAIANKNYPTIGMAESSTPDICEKLQNIGVNFHSYPVERNGLNPLADLKTLKVLRSTFKTLQPTAVLAYTIKPIIWGGVASRVSPSIQFYAMIEGVGYAFQGTTWRRKLLTFIASQLYKIALLNARKVIFLNPDNLSEFVNRKIIPEHKAYIVNGTGIDLNLYNYTPLSNRQPIFLTIGRLLGEKGFREYVQAAQIVKAHYPEATFQLLGPEDPSPDGISLDEVQSWIDQGWIEYLGSTNDVRPYLQNCHIYVLPSYHEGMPRTVLEAMATGRPILTTDVPGCRETVVNGENGYLVTKADAKVLAERMIWFVENRDQWECMGRCSRELAEERYDVHEVNAQLMEIMEL